MYCLRQAAEPGRKTRMVRKPDRSSRVKKRRRRFCPECGGRIVLARENEYYTATELCCSSCGLVYDDELMIDLIDENFFLPGKKFPSRKFLKFALSVSERHKPLKSA